jgi:hypothetical protein
MGTDSHASQTGLNLMRLNTHTDCMRSLLLVSCVFLLQACQGILAPAANSRNLTALSDEEVTVRLAAEYGATIRTIESNGINLRIAEAG